MIPDAIAGALGYIEENLSEPLDIEAVSGRCFLSPAQLYRLFYSATGHSVKEYIRKRRLSEALRRVKEGGQSFADIAAAWGYGSQQAFCKRVKASVGMTPLEYRESALCFCFPPMPPGREFHVSVGAERLPPTVALEYRHSSMKDVETRALSAFFHVCPDYAGRLFGRNGGQKGTRFSYRLFAEHGEELLKKRALLEENGFLGFELVPGGNEICAKTLVCNDGRKIERAWNFLYTDWLRASMFEPGGAPYYEEYLHAKGRAKRLVLCLPVKKREGFDAVECVRRGETRFFAARGSTEEGAASALVGFLLKRQPRLLREATRFYVSRQGFETFCGVAADHGEENVEGAGALGLVRHPEGEYALLRGACCGDGGVYGKILLSWAEENGREAEGEPFTVFHTDRGFAAESILTETFVRLREKSDKNGQYGAAAGRYNRFKSDDDM